jgi:hypothetical protein
MTAFSPVLDGLRPVFVVGHPRSGTTLVQQLLTAHPAFWSAPETHLYTYVLDPVENWQNRPLRAGEIPGIVTRLSEKPAIKLSSSTVETLTNEAKRGVLGAAQLLNLIMQAHKPQGSTAERWLEKTPRHVYHLSAILRFFPDARVIHVLRDPRGVASSPQRFSELEPGFDRNVMAIERGDSWNRVVDLTDAMADETRLITVRYEDIISDQKAALQRMTNHVGAEYDPSVYERFSSTYSQITVSSENVRKQLNAVGEIVDRRAVYRQRMTEEEIALVDTVCTERMLRKGYVPDGDAQPELVARLRAQIPVKSAPAKQTPESGFVRIIRSAVRRLQRRLGAN